MPASSFNVKTINCRYDNIVYNLKIENRRQWKILSHQILSKRSFSRVEFVASKGKWRKRKRLHAPFGIYVPRRTNMAHEK